MPAGCRASPAVPWVTPDAAGRLLMPERKDLSRRDLLLLAGHIGMAGALLPASAAATPDKANPFLQHGFAPVLDELAVAELTVRGELPRQIAGNYLRNGANPAYPPISYTYPFDGDGMVHGVTVENGKASYRNRFVLTAGLRADRRAGRTIYGGLLNPIVPDPRFVPPDGDPSRFKNVANTNVVRHAGRILALHEGSLPYELSPTLETRGLYDFGGKIDDAMTAHPKIDPVSGEMLMFRYWLRPPFLTLRVVDASGTIVRDVPVDTGLPYMVHDFSFTASHVVFFLCPVVFDAEGARQGKPFLSWQPERGTRIAVLRRDGTGGVQWIADDAFFVYHFMNAHESDGRITIDYVQHGAFFTARAAPPTLWRAVLDLKAGAVKRTRLDERIGEFPRVEPARAGAANRYGWLPVKAHDDAVGTFGAIARYDLSTGRSAVHVFGRGR
ncbi:MAG: carotenoid oxygenase family protein [Alphaproteobacteria bacterium]|nr:carotenoid oxygenase family protein [Alphaproteobacteria bacterium]